jgi:hypothetical protein
MKDFPKDLSVMIELLNRTAEETAVRVAETADWVGLIEQAMACNPAPLQSLLLQLGGKKDLYPVPMQKFLALMEQYKPKSGRPRKDGNDALREAAKAWERLYLKGTLQTVANAYNAAKRLDKRHDRHISIESLPNRVRIEIKPGAAKRLSRLPGVDKATDLALGAMSDALMGSSEEALRNKIYPRKKGTTKKPK